MAISFPLVAKVAAATTALVGSGTLGIIYKNEIEDFLIPAKTKQEKIKRILNRLGIEKEFQDTGQNEWDLTKGELEKISFSGIESKVSEENNDNTKLVKLKVESVSVAEGSENDFELKFTFSEIVKDITIGKENNQISLKPKTNLEFKVNKSDNKLKKLWDIKSLSKQINLNCPKEGENNKCSIENNKKINVKEGSNKLEDVTFTGGEITFEKDQKNHNQGFKFTVTSDATLSKTGNSESLNPSKLTKDNTSYEIIKDGDKWYLSKVEQTTQENQ